MALLRRVTFSFLALAVVGRLPMALISVGAWRTDATWLPVIAHTITGYAGGIGLAAAIGLIAVKIGSNRCRIMTALVALGQRSLTFYLFQSVVFVALFYPLTLDLADDMGAAGAGRVRKTKEVTAPKLPPPAPRRAQNSSSS